MYAIALYSEKVQCPGTDINIITITPYTQPSIYFHRMQHPPDLSNLNLRTFSVQMIQVSDVKRYLVGGKVDMKVFQNRAQE